MEQGYIIAIEGTDGCGKNTQAKLLKNKLLKMGKKVFMCSFPNYSSVSSAPVKMYLNGELGSSANDTNAYQASTLFAVDRLCTYKTLIKPHIENGEIIILDRYTPSNALHQACKLSSTDEVDEFLNWLFDFEYNLLELPIPDKVFFLDVPTEVSENLRKLREAQMALKSGETNDIHEHDRTHLKKAYLTGKYVAQKYHWDQVNCINELGGLLSIEEINNKMMDRLLADKNFAKLKQ